MTKKLKIFGYQIRLDWLIFKTNFKFILRKAAYSFLLTELITTLLKSYMFLVYFSSKKRFLNLEILVEAAQNKRPILIVFWHNRLMMIPFIARAAKKQCRDYNFMTLSSKHGDGRFVGRTMEKFQFISIYGSTKNGRKASRGIDFTSLRQILNGLKNGYSIGLTPDGPRGPNQKINGNIIEIARISGAKILPVSYSSSRFIKLKTWDEFKIPLPFSKLCFYLDSQALEVAKDANPEEIEKIKILAEEKINMAQNHADSNL